MNLEGLASDGTVRRKGFSPGYFRVADVVSREISPGHYELFVSHHYYVENCIEFRVSSALLQVREDEPPLLGSWKRIYSARPCITFQRSGHVFGGIQAGGRMVVDDNDHLFVVVGDHTWDGHDEGRPNAPMNPNFDLGKLVRIDLNSGSAQVVSSGLRNPQGLARDAQGNLWETEHGPQGGDELNLLLPGNNYGWPEVTYGIQYGNKNWRFNPIQGRHEGFAKPIHAWIPSIAISSIVFSDGPQFPRWRGDLLIASLAAKSLFRARLGERRVIYVEKMRIGHRLRDVAEMNDGRIALLTDDAKVIFLERSTDLCNKDAMDHIYQTVCEKLCDGEDRDHFYQEPCEEPPGDVDGTADNSDDAQGGAGDFEALYEPLDVTSRTVTGAESFDRHCSSCHNLFEVHGVGPHLVELMGRRSGSVSDYNFSAALASLDITWSRENLIRYLVNAGDFAPGGKMPVIDISEPEAQAVAEYLEALGNR
jgi:cytochrome c2